MKQSAVVLGAFCLAALLGGAIFGFLPVTDMETSLKHYGETVECGSAFNVNDGELTSYGISSCEDAGLSRNRTIAIALLVIGGVLGIAAVVVGLSGGSSQSGTQPGTGSPSSTAQPPSLTASLAQLDDARSSGLISDEEYIASRRSLLGM